MPAMQTFIPDGESQAELTLSIDEFEAIRLLDYEGLTQEQCALQMNVARATITLIYESARRKIADAFVNRKSIRICGGNYKLCENAENCCGQCSKGGCEQCQNKACKQFMQEK